MKLTPEQFNKLVTKDEFSEFKNEFFAMKDDFYILKDEFSEFKDQLFLLKDDFYIFKDEFSEFKQDMDEKINILISMLEKNSTKEKDHDMEHVSNIVAHDRFQKEIEQIKNQIQAPANA